MTGRGLFRLKSLQWGGLKRTWEARIRAFDEWRPDLVLCLRTLAGDASLEVSGYLTADLEE